MDYFHQTITRKKEKKKKEKKKKQQQQKSRLFFLLKNQSVPIGQESFSFSCCEYFDQNLMMSKKVFLSRFLFLAIVAINLSMQGDTRFLR